MNDFIEQCTGDEVGHVEMHRLSEALLPKPPRRTREGQTREEETFPDLVHPTRDIGIITIKGYRQIKSSDLTQGITPHHHVAGHTHKAYRTSHARRQPPVRLRKGLRKWSDIMIAIGTAGEDELGVFEDLLDLDKSVLLHMSISIQEGHQVTRRLVKGSLACKTRTLSFFLEDFNTRVGRRYLESLIATVIVHHDDLMDTIPILGHVVETGHYLILFVVGWNAYRDFEGTLGTRLGRVRSRLG